MARQWTEDEIKAAVSHFHNLTLEERRNLNRYQRWYDYTFARWRCNGKVHTWVARPKEVSVPAKHGLRTYDQFTEHDSMLVGPQALAEGLRKQYLNAEPHLGRVVIARAITERFTEARV